MLNRRYVQWLAFAVGALLVVPGAGAQRPGKPLIEEVAQAMGGRDRILSVRTLILEGSGEQYNLGQNRFPQAELPTYVVNELPDSRSRCADERAARGSVAIRER